MRLLPGLLACVALAVVAEILGSYVPLVGAPVFAIVLGVAIAAVRPLSPLWSTGTGFAAKVVLQWSIVLLGAQLSLAEIASGGRAALPVMLGTFVLVLLIAYFAGRALALDRDLRRLLAIGTAICGGSAIAALSSVIEVDRSDVAYALATIFFFNVVAVLMFPALGHALQLTQGAFGLWAGTAINDTSSVVAAAFAYGHAAGNAAVVVKLTRTLLIVPVVLYYAWRRMLAHRAGDKPVPWRSVIPWFILWFLVAATLDSIGAIPAGWHAPIQRIALFTIVVALAGVGLSSDLSRIKAAGFRPLVLGAVLWVAIVLGSLAIAHYTNVSM